MCDCAFDSFQVESNKVSLLQPYSPDVKGQNAVPRHLPFLFGAPDTPIAQPLVLAPFVSHRTATKRGDSSGAEGGGPAAAGDSAPGAAHGAGAHLREARPLR